MPGPSRPSSNRILDQEEAGQCDAGAPRATQTRARPAAAQARVRRCAQPRGAAVPTSQPARGAGPWRGFAFCRLHNRRRFRLSAGSIGGAAAQQAVASASTGCDGRCGRIGRGFAAVAQGASFVAQERDLVFQALGSAKGGDGGPGAPKTKKTPPADRISPQRQERNRTLGAPRSRATRRSRRRPAASWRGAGGSCNRRL